MEQEIVLNSHNKQEDPRMHSAEHLLNGTMVKMIGCKRSRNTHIERKKSKCDYPLSEPLTQEQLQEIETTINNVIAQDLRVTYEFISAKEAEKLYDLDYRIKSGQVDPYYGFELFLLNFKEEQ